MNVFLAARFVLIVAFVAVVAVMVSTGMTALEQVSAVLPSGDVSTLTDAPVWQGDR